MTALRYTARRRCSARAFLYYGLKAVQLTEMSNRVWKRTAEYNLILAERQRLGVQKQLTRSGRLRACLRFLAPLAALALARS